MAPPTATATSGGVILNQANIDLLVAICKQNPSVNYNQLASDLNVNVGTASKQWSRFKLEKLKISSKNGDKQGQVNDGDEGEVTPKTKGGKKAARGSSGKKRGRAADENDDESPSKKAAATKKGARGKKGGQAVQDEEHGEGLADDVERLEVESIKEEAQHQYYDDEQVVYEDAEE